MSAVERYGFPGRRISVDGGSVHVVASGTGSPTVVFESGMGGNLLDWTAVTAALPSGVQVLAYDRSGLGWSDPRPGPRTPERIVDELETILGAAGADPPYVFVAHSMGARYARLFAARHPGDVAGLVLVDGYHESWDAAVGPDALASFITARLRLWRLVGLLARVGVVRLLGGRLVSLLGPDYRHMPDTERARYVAMLAEGRALQVAGDELRHGGDSSDALRSASLGDLPLVVITHGLPFRDEMQEQAWQGSQVEMAARSSRGRLVRAARSAHSVMIAEPQVVLDAIGDVIREG